jgi:hypothetical protein
VPVALDKEVMSSSGFLPWRMVMVTYCTPAFKEIEWYCFQRDRMVLQLYESSTMPSHQLSHERLLSVDNNLSNIIMPV